MSEAIEVTVVAPDWRRALPRAPSYVKAAVRATLAHRGASGAVCVLLADDARLQALNAQYRAKDAPTNVLAFAPPQPSFGFLGDIALAFGVCAREAAEQGKSLHDHLQHLTTHGVLHLLGYDHQTEAEAEAMEAAERAILAGLDVADPYAERPAQADHVRHPT